MLKSHGIERKSSGAVVGKMLNEFSAYAAGVQWLA
jgi:hypothetical protein